MSDPSMEESQSHWEAGQCRPRARGSGGSPASTNLSGDAKGSLGDKAGEAVPMTHSSSLGLALSLGR